VNEVACRPGGCGGCGDHRGLDATAR
jgi:hypothetical protein